MKKHIKLDLYPVTIEPHEEGGYFASCPLFQGCHAEGETFGEAIDSMRDVIHAHIEARKEFAEFVPSVEFPATAEIRFTLPVPISR